MNEQNEQNEQVEQPVSAGRASDIDRSTWPAGPWDAEGDRYEWRHLGFPCLIIRNRSGALCGYVGVSEGHPWFGKTTHDLMPDVHGGLSYSNSCEASPIICHVPRPGEPDHVYWLGFDCGHSGDLQPGHEVWVRELEERMGRPVRVLNHKTDVGRSGVLYDRRDYRDVAYVATEVRRLAEQAAEAR